MTKKPLDNSQFSPEELLTAKREFDFLYDGKIENPCEYLERKRNRDMRNLIFHIIENELDEARKEIFKRVFFGGEKISDVAKEMNICVSNAYKHYDKALKRIEESLKYVVFYQNECLHNRLKPLEVMKASSLRYRGSASSPQISMRLSRLMHLENVEKEKLCRCTGISEKRFENIFYGKEQLTAGEIATLSGFFGVSADYILKGDFS